MRAARRARGAARRAGRSVRPSSRPAGSVSCAMGVTRLAKGMEELLEACGDPDGVLDSIRHARRVYRHGLSTAGESFIDEGEDDDSSEESSSDTDSDDSSFSSSEDHAEARDGGGDNAAACEQSRSSTGNGKRYEGTDEERAERLARMMAAQCTMEAPEKVGLRTGWKPSSSGFGVVPDSAVGSGLGRWTSFSGGKSAEAASTTLTAAASSTSAVAGIASPPTGFSFAFVPHSSSVRVHDANRSKSNSETDVRATIAAAQRAYVAVSGATLSHNHHSRDGVL